MKISCEIVKDLLPLYHDDVCSKESCSAVEEHLQECTACKKYLDSMNGDFNPKHIEKTAEQAKCDTLKGIKKKLFRKKVLISLVSVLCAIAVCLGGFSLIFHYQMPISYKDKLLSVDMAYDGVIDIIFNGDDYYRSYGLTKRIKKDGKEQNAAYIYYTDSIWTKYFSKPRNHDKYQFSIGNSIMVDYAKNGESIQSDKDITAVYYLTGNYRTLAQMSPEKFAEATQKAILLWEK